MRFSVIFSTKAVIIHPKKYFNHQATSENIQTLFSFAATERDPYVHEFFNDQMLPRNPPKLIWN